MAKATKTTLKSFVNKNKGRLLLKVSQKFNGLDDCLDSVKGSFVKANFSSKLSFFKELLKHYKENQSSFLSLSKDDKILELNNRYDKFIKESLGIKGVKVLKDSLIEAYEDANYKGFSVFNCVNKVIFAIEK